MAILQRITGVALRGIVCTVPGEPIPVECIGEHLKNEDVQKISKTTGVKQLYRAGEHQTAGDLCLAAAEKLISELCWAPETIDGVIMVTQTPDYFLPATACVIHGKLGLPDTCIAFDISLGCSGYIYGLCLASQMVANRVCRRLLLLAGDTIGKAVSPYDQSVATLFGDAGSATALEAVNEDDPWSFVMGTDGQGYQSLILPAGGWRLRATPETWVRVDCADGTLRAPTDLLMDGLEVFSFSVKRVPPLIKDVLRVQGWDISTLDALLLHQANTFVINTIAKKLGLDESRVPVNLDRYGNTSMASIPLLLADDMRLMISRSEPSKLVLAGFGVGFSWAAAALTLGGINTALVWKVPRGGEDHLQSSELIK